MPGLKTLARGALDSTSLGNMILAEGLVGRDRMTELLSEFKETCSEGYFGQFLVKKGVISKEKLGILLIRQSAARNGGVGRRHVEQAKVIAEKTSNRLMEELESFMDGLKKSLAKSEAGAPGDTRS